MGIPSINFGNMGAGFNPPDPRFMAPPNVGDPFGNQPGQLVDQGSYYGMNNPVTPAFAQVSAGMNYGPQAAPQGGPDMIGAPVAPGNNFSHSQPGSLIDYNDPNQGLMIGMDGTPIQQGGGRMPPQPSPWQSQPGFAAPVPGANYGPLPGAPGVTPQTPDYSHLNPRHGENNIPVPQQQGFAPAPQVNYGAAPPTGLIGAEQALGGGLRGALGILEQAAGRMSGTGGAVGAGQGAISFNGGGGGAGLAGSRNQGLEAINKAVNQGVEGLQGFMGPGQQSQQQQAALSGALGPEAQQAAYAAFSNSPGQQWLQEQGMRQVTRGASATGGLGGGRVQEELMRQGQGLAQQDFQNQFNNLGQVTGQGLSAAQNIGNLRGQQAGLSSGLIGQIAGAEAGLQGQRIGAGAQIQSAAMNNAAANNRANMANLTSLAQQGSSQAFDTGRFMAGGRMDVGQQMAGNIGSTTSGLANLTNQQGSNISNILGALGQNQANIQGTAGSASAAELANLAALLGNISQGQASTQAGLPAIGGFVQPDNTSQNIGNLAQTLGGIYGAYQQSQQPQPTTA